ncbi:hypothetical protein [Methanocalculus taiwanensis]|uniref:hypothetical protein n=1 Tax=Methanocalculus taiwanensis TaxID=106207 RepID=UPI00210072FF|nr:hypothetical protein [Methanocalculus taiwanensis]
MLGAMGAIGRLAGIAERLLDDTRLKEKWEKDGRVKGRVEIDEYDLIFELVRRSDD